MLMKTRLGTLRDNQQGFASIVIALVLILIVSLITIGFAQLMRREQRAALDRQLSSQAYYAAESGINDAAAAINAGFDTSKSSCAALTAAQVSAITDPKAQTAAQTYLMNNGVGSSTGSNYPCLLINPTPPNLQYSSIDTTTSKVIELEGLDSSNNPAAVQTIEISWQDANGNSTFTPSCSTFYPASGGATNWTYTGLLRAELIPINTLTRTGLINNADTAFLCPDKISSNSSNYSGNQGNASGVIIGGQCSTAAPTPTSPRYCNARITGLGTLNEATYFLVLRSIYNPAAVTVTIYGGTGTVTQANMLNINGAQVLVDSTGKAQDVLRRIQARIPVHNNYNTPNGGADAMQSLCKQLQLTPTGVSTGDGINCTTILP